MTDAATKAAARQTALVARARAHAVAGGDGTDLLIRALCPHLGQVIAGYHAIRSEIDPMPAMIHAAAHGPVGLPVIVGPDQPLVFHRWTPGAPLRDGPFGARIPVDGAPLTPDVLIVPLVAFDGQGNRLGYGGGYYDRTLERLRAARPTLAIGFAYAVQQVETLPREPTDQSLDLIVTDREIITPRVRP